MKDTCILCGDPLPIDYVVIGIDICDNCAEETCQLPKDFDLDKELEE